jgi:hypothetical protein
MMPLYIERKTRCPVEARPVKAARRNLMCADCLLSTVYGQLPITSTGALLRRLINNVAWHTSSCLLNLPTQLERTTERSLKSTKCVIEWDM